jgi:hypothetical protein
MTDSAALLLGILMLAFMSGIIALIWRLAIFGICG